MKTHIQGPGDATLCGRTGPALQTVPPGSATDADCILCRKFSGMDAGTVTAAAKKPAAAAKAKKMAPLKAKARVAKKAAGAKKAKPAISEARIREIVREEIAAQGSPFDLLSTKEAAALLGVGRRKVEKWVKAGKLAAVDLSQKQIRIARETVDGLLEKRGK